MIATRGDPVFICHPTGFTLATYQRKAKFGDRRDSSDAHPFVVVRIRSNGRGNYHDRVVPLSDLAPATPEARRVVAEANAAREEGFSKMREAINLARKLGRLA